MEEARNLNHNYVGTEHILLGLLREQEGVAAQVLMNLGLQAGRSSRRGPESYSAMTWNRMQADVKADAKAAHPNRRPRKVAKARLPHSTGFGRDLTDLARQKKLDPVIGREREIERAIQILCRRTKNNPVLLGEAGVGKTAIVEGFAQRVVAGNVPELLTEKRIVVLDSSDDGRWYEVSRPVRRAHQGGHERSPPREEYDPVHR